LWQSAKDPFGSSGFEIGARQIERLDLENSRFAEFGFRGRFEMGKSVRLQSGFETAPSHSIL
jgi:hypothetical protein